jgi:thioredoxin 1
MMWLAVCLLVGGGLGALLGRAGKCLTGSCPLTASWKSGAVYGAVLGLIFYFASGGNYQPPKNIKAITEAQFDAEVTQSSRLVVVDFYAPWCGPCKVLSPRLDKLAGEFGNRIKFVSVNVDQSPALAAKFNVEGTPTVLFFGKEGKVVGGFTGVASAGDLREKLESLLAHNESPATTTGKAL